LHTDTHIHIGTQTAATTQPSPKHCGNPAMLTRPQGTRPRPRTWASRPRSRPKILEGQGQAEA